MSDTVLIVDDSLTVRMDLAEAFDTAGFTSLLCADIASAREALYDTQVGLIILDIILPDGDGLEFLEEILSTPSTAHIPVLMLSSEVDVKDRIRGLATGATEYVGKPYDSVYVVARARELLEVKSDSDGKTTILVIDGSTTVREELCTVLENADYHVLSAANGKDGLQIAANRRPSAIVVDGVMEGMDGASFIRRIRLDAALRDIPCVLLTGSENPGGELDALDAGADAFVRKGEGIDLILARLAAVLRHANNTAKEETTSLFSPKRIMAVDDSETYLHEIAEQLYGEGYDVLLAHSGEEALEMIAVQQVDCILLDLMMPGIGGQETCRQIKSSDSTRDIPVIMLTALDDRATMIEGLSLGADDFIQKSGEFEVLKARLKAQIRRKQFEDEHRRTQAKLIQAELEAREMRAAQKLAEVKSELLEELEFKNKELEAFSYSVSHDLRAPLRAINGFSSILLEDYLDSLDDEGQSYLYNLREATEQMEQLIDALLSLSRITRHTLNNELVNLSDLAYGIVDQLYNQNSSKQVELYIQDEMVVQGDTQLLRVALENLISNAWKYTGKREVAIIEFGCMPLSEFRALGDMPLAPRHLSSRVFFVQDNGAGFDMEYATKLFTPFQRLHGVEEFPGTGVGLATVQRIINRHGGHIWANAAQNEGAAFYFTLENT